jgi:predicted DNA-binding protein
MTTQMIVRVDDELKNRAAKFARGEGKNLSELVRELLEKYTRERDMTLYVDDLWSRIGKKISISDESLEDAIAQVRSEHV